MPKLANLPVYDLPPAIRVVAGEIVVLGPGPAAFSMTLKAAIEMRRRLQLAIDKALLAA